MFLSRRHRHTDRGFTLIEIVVALGILSLVASALLPQLVVGIRANGVARTVSQAKGVAQGQLDRMRNLPYHVSPAAGDYRDVLDFYYRNMTAGTTAVCPLTGPHVLPQANWTGYVAAGGARCRYEPATGPFYRSVEVVPASTGNGGFTVVVDTQFLSGATPPVALTPPAGYNTQTSGQATPVSSQLGITVTVIYTTSGVVHPVTTFTQLAETPSTAIRINAVAGATTLDLGSETPSNGPISYSAGLVKLAGSLTYTSTVGGSISSTAAGLGTGENAVGASNSITAPPSAAASTVTGSPGALSAGCDLACWGNTRLDLGAVSSDGGRPNAGSVSSPMQALLTNPGTNGISFGSSAASFYRLGLKLATPLVRLDPNAGSSASGLATGCVLGSGGTASYIQASGYLTTTSDTVDTCAVAKGASVSLFPTDFAPRGVVLIELRRATARCRVAGAAHTATATSDYRADVRYYNGNSYESLPNIVPSNTTDPLDAVDLANTSVGGGKQLGDYISSWSSLLGAEVLTTQTTGLAEVEVPGVVTIASQPVRPGLDLLDPVNPSSALIDPTSVVSLTMGAVNCSVLDQR